MGFEAPSGANVTQALGHYGTRVTDMTGGGNLYGRSLWVVPLDFDFSGDMDTWATLDLPDGQAGFVVADI